MRSAGSGYRYGLIIWIPNYRENMRVKLDVLLSYVLVSDGSKETIQSLSIWQRLYFLILGKRPFLNPKPVIQIREQFSLEAILVTRPRRLWRIVAAASVAGRWCRNAISWTASRTAWKSLPALPVKIVGLTIRLCWWAELGPGGREFQCPRCAKADALQDMLRPRMVIYYCSFYSVSTCLWSSTTRPPPISETSECFYNRRGVTKWRSSSMKFYSLSHLNI